MCQLAKLTAEEDVLALVELLEVTLLYHQHHRWGQYHAVSMTLLYIIVVFWQKA